MYANRRDLKIAMLRKNRKKKKHNRKTLTGGYTKKFIQTPYSQIGGDQPRTFEFYGLNYRANIVQFVLLDIVMMQRKKCKYMTRKFVQGMAMNYGYTLT